MIDRSQPSIAVAMSGGVDSTVCAALLQKKYDVHGFFMDLGLPGRDVHIAKVRRVADALSIPLTIIELAPFFEKEVIKYFTKSYGLGITPNPCVICNPVMKFGRLLEEVKKRGMEKMATGHYVRLSRTDTGIHLSKGADGKKDQSYFLCLLTAEQLARLEFPLGELTKKEVFKKAESLGFHHFSGTESQDICFLSNSSVGEFLQKRIPFTQGEIVTADGEIKGHHQGIFNYTIGQRRGLGICDSTPFYVTALSAQKNQVIVGKEKDLWHNELLVHKVNWTRGSAPQLPAKLQVKIRYRHQAAEARISREGDFIRIIFDEPQRAITAGQFAVVYDEDEVLGGGEILPPQQPLKKRL